MVDPCGVQAMLCYLWGTLCILGTEYCAGYYTIQITHPTCSA